MTAEDKIDYLELPARDLVKAEAFFIAMFDWKFESYGPEYCSFSDGRMAGGFFRSDLRSQTANGSCLIVFYKADLEAAADKIREHGGTVTKDVFSFPGGKRLHFEDPNGNEYAIWTDQ